MALIIPCAIGLRSHANSITRFTHSVSITNEYTRLVFSVLRRGIRNGFGLPTERFGTVLCGKEEITFFILFRRSPGTVIWAIREWYGMRGVKMGTGGRNASLQQKTRKQKRNLHPHTYTRGR